MDFYLEKQKKKKLKNLLTEEKSYKYRGMNDRKNKRYFDQSPAASRSDGKKLHEGFMRVSKRDIHATNRPTKQR